MQVGIDSFVNVKPDNREAAAQRMAELLEEIELADNLGLDVYAIGEHHREEYLASSPATILAAAAARTKNIRLASAVTVLSSDDPVRVFQQFATVDLISKGRAEIIVGRGSFTESYPLFGFDLADYDALFAEKLDLLLKLQGEVKPQWNGKFRPSLQGQGVYPQPYQQKLPIRLGVGGSPNSFVRAGVLGLPLTVAIIGGDPAQFRPYVDLYRRAWAESGHDPAGMDVAVHSIGFMAETFDEAAETFFPSYERVFTKIGKERGWGPISRANFDSETELDGALMVGDPARIAAKINRANEALGGVSRWSVLMDSGTIPHETMLKSVEMLAEAKALIR